MERLLSRPVLSMLALALLAGGCAYPKRSTPLREVGAVDDALGAPADLWRLTVVAAEVPPRRRGGLAWDTGGGKPDPQVRLYRDGAHLWTSEQASDTLTPRFDESLPGNVTIPSGEPFRIELWDHDEVDGDPIGVWRGTGLPGNVLPGADARVTLDSGAVVVMRVEPPHAHEGSGITKYEVRSEWLRVIEVVQSSPASRAGIREGDRIVAIEGQNVAELGEAAAASKLSMGGRNASLTYERDGKQEQVQLDGGYVWLSM